MAKKPKSIEHFKPSMIHKLFSWIDRLPGPYWLFYICLLFITGLLNHLVAWNENVIEFGEINLDFALTGFFLSYYLFANDFLFRVAKDSLVEFRPILETADDEYHRILFEFTHLPSRNSAVFFIIGAIIGLTLGLYLLPTAPEMNYAFPELEVPMYTLSLGMVFITLSAAIRALRLIRQLFSRLVKVDIFDQGSIYAISRYSAWLLIITAVPAYLQFVLIPSFASITANLVFITVIPGIVVLAIFWFPLQGINRKLVWEKRKLIKDIDLRIKTNFEIIHSRMDNQEYKNIVDVKEMIESLQIERKYIKAIRTWPWDTSTLTSLLTVLVLPLLGSLLVEIVSRLITF